MDCEPPPGDGDGGLACARSRQPLRRIHRPAFEVAMSTGVSPLEAADPGVVPAPDPRAAAREPFVVALVWLVPFVLAMVFVGLLKPSTAVQTKYLFTLVALIVPVAIAWLVSRASVRAPPFGAALAAAFPPLLIMLGLTGTRWYFSGVVGDQSYRLEYVTRFAHSPAL